MAGATVTVTDATFAAEVEQTKGLTVVDFWATWCGPCRIISPILEQIAAERAGEVKVAKVDVDENQRTAARFNIRSMPTLLFFKDGQPVGQIIGAVPRAHIESAIAQLA
ncbi:thioredoxin [Longimicrobium sp.]|uniref:thioredoxin n=1 Tax=Longimicrobium sp. TaxID=2029185 RepID=UPI002E32C15D|nr:thioredoxin [Longimicrobium sp.]HEX6041046.1 thioredoxin [Longimicrobium sp.]